MSRAERIERAGWNPWRELRNRPELRVGRCLLPDGVDGALVNHPERPVILLDDNLDQVERNAALAHELVHLERDWPCQANWAEEERVHNEVADRLVPIARLRDWWIRAETTGEHVRPHEVAEHFHVPEYLAERAMRRLLASIQQDIKEHRRRRREGGWTD